jgi:hypothetical protein
MRRTVDNVAALILRLQRLGYSTQTFATEIVVEFDRHSKLRGSASEIEGILPSLERVLKGGSPRAAKPRGGRKKKRRVRKKGKLK